MTTTTILFEAITAAQKAYDTLKPMIEVSKNCNALNFDEIDEELVKWLIRDRYCQLGQKKRIYPYPVSIIGKSTHAICEAVSFRTLYQYQDLQIEQKFIPPADCEFVTRDCEASRRHRFGKTINSIWWGYEDEDTNFEETSKSRDVRGSIDIGFYIENFLERCKVGQ